MSQSLSLQQCLFTSMLARLIMRAEEMGYKIKIQELNRTLETQKEYVAKGVSKTMNSKHLDKLAADIVLFSGGEPLPDFELYKPLGKFWESLGPGFVWGGSWESFKDWPHFQYSEQNESSRKA